MLKKSETFCFSERVPGEKECVQLRIRIVGIEITIRTDQSGIARYLAEHFVGFGSVECLNPSEVYDSKKSDIQIDIEIDNHLEIPESISAIDLDELGRGWGTVDSEINILLQMDLSSSRVGCVAFHNHQRATLSILLPNVDEKSCRWALRHIRSLIEFELISRGWIAIHSSALSERQGAVCFPGDKFSGKSTTLFGALFSSIGGFLANDRVYLNYDADNSPLAVALPFSAGIRRTTIDLFSEFGQRKDALIAKHPENSSLEDSDTKIYISTPTIVELIGKDVANVTGILAFVFPKFQKDLKSPLIAKLSEESSGRMLLEQHQPAPFFYQNYYCMLREKLGVGPDLAIKKRVRQLAKDVPCYVLNQGQSHRFIVNKFIHNLVNHQSERIK